MTPFIAEVIGTFLLILLGNGVVANVILADTKGNGPHNWLLISFGWGMAVFVAVFVSMDVSGAHLNPAVTLGLALAGKFPWADVGTYVLAQMIGAMLGTSFVWLTYRDHYNRTEDQGTILATFATGPAIRNLFNNCLTEVIGTFVLVFGALYIGGPTLEATGMEGAKVGLGAMGALPVGLLVFAIGMSLGGATGYAINPARDLGPRIMHAILPIPNKGGSDWSYAWVPIVGPVIGGMLAGVLFLML